MRTFITTIALALTSMTIFACDAGSDATPGVTAGAARPTTSDESVCGTGDALAMTSCHAAYREAMGRIDTALEEAGSCEVDADCTVTVSETRCTGEIVTAVNGDNEESFLSFIDRVDARLCGDVASVCDTGSDADPKPLKAACVESRCVIAE